jgi:hypothetical protein
VAAYYLLPIWIFPADSNGVQIVRSESPLSLMELRNSSDVIQNYYLFKLLPDSATRIQYTFFTYNNPYGPDGFTDYLRFEAPYADLVQYVKDLAENANTDTMHLDDLLEVKKITSETKLDREASQELERVDWFDIENIDNGEIRGSTISFIPQIYIDRERGILYYTVSD